LGKNLILTSPLDVISLIQTFVFTFNFVPNSFSLEFFSLLIPSTEKVLLDSTSLGVEEVLAFASSYI
jgi:hypothetical protein